MQMIQITLYVYNTMIISKRRVQNCDIYFAVHHWHTHIGLASRLVHNPMSDVYSSKYITVLYITLLYNPILSINICEKTEHGF